VQGVLLGCEGALFELQVLLLLRYLLGVRIWGVKVRIWRLGVVISVQSVLLGFEGALFELQVLFLFAT